MLILFLDTIKLFQIRIADKNRLWFPKKVFIWSIRCGIETHLSSQIDFTSLLRFMHKLFGTSHRMRKHWKRLLFFSLILDHFLIWEWFLLLVITVIHHAIGIHRLINMAHLRCSCYYRAFSQLIIIYVVEICFHILIKLAFISYSTLLDHDILSNLFLRTRWIIVYLTIILLLVYLAVVGMTESNFFFFSYAISKLVVIISKIGLFLHLIHHYSLWLYITLSFSVFIVNGRL